MQAVDRNIEPAPPESSPDIRPQPLWDRLVALLLIAAVSVPLAMVGLTWSRDTMQFENRRADPWPRWSEWTFRNARSFTSAFERAFNDRFGGRDQLVKLHNIVQAVVLRKSPAPGVIIGKDGWLFVMGGWVQAYQGHEPFPRNTNEAIAKAIETRARLVQEMGIAYRLLYSPDKHTIYPEYVPDKMRAGARRTRMDEIIEALPADIRPLVLDLREPLLKAKHEGPLFHKTDSHWNSRGAWVGYQELARSLGIDPLPYPAGPEDFTPRTYAGDLARMMGADLFFNEADLLPKFAAGRSIERCQQPTFVSPRYRSQKFACPDAPLARLAIYHDSFGIALMAYASSLARETEVVSNAHTLDVAWLQQFKPTVMVDQIVERGLPNLALPITAFQKASFLPALSDIAMTLPCSIGNVAHEEGTAHPARKISADGRAVYPAGETPQRVWLVLTGENGSYAAETITNRPELWIAFGAPALDPSVFNLIAGGDELQPGDYAVGLVAKFGDRFAKCSSGKSLTIPK